MWRAVGSIVSGLMTWVAVVTLLNFGLRAAIPGYHAAEATLLFTMAMKIGRLTEAAFASLAAGAVIGLIAPSKKWAPWVTGLIILGLFLPEHVKLWTRFPPWYHLSFLVSIVPLVALGGLLARSAAAPSGSTVTAS